MSVDVRVQRCSDRIERCNDVTELRKILHAMLNFGFSEDQFSALYAELSQRRRMLMEESRKG